MSFTPVPLYFVNDERRSKFHKLASVTYGNATEGLNVFWDEKTRTFFFQVKDNAFCAYGTKEVMYEECEDLSEDGYCGVCATLYGSHPVRDFYGNVLLTDEVHEWWMSPDANILESVAYFTYTLPCMIYFSNFFIFNKNHENQGKVADDDVQVSVYESEWSDFACEKMYLEFSVMNGCYFKDNLQRGGFVLAELYDGADAREYENALRKKTVAKEEKLCACKWPDPHKSVTSAGVTLYVGDICLKCLCDITPERRAHILDFWHELDEVYKSRAICS